MRVACELREKDLEMFKIEREREIAEIRLEAEIKENENNKQKEFKRLEDHGRYERATMFGVTKFVPRFLST